MTDKQIQVGDVVDWDKVPSRAIARGVARHNREAFYFRHGDDGWYVGGIAPLTKRRGFLDIPPHGNCWPRWNAWPGAPDHVTIIALDLTGQETAADLQRLAEVYEVREALSRALKTSADEPERCSDEVFDLVGVVLWLSGLTVGALAERLQMGDMTVPGGVEERLHAAGWRPGMTAEDAARLLTGAG